MFLIYINLMWKTIFDIKTGFHIWKNSQQRVFRQIDYNIFDQRGLFSNLFFLVFSWSATFDIFLWRADVSLIFFFVCVHISLKEPCRVNRLMWLQNFTNEIRIVTILWHPLFVYPSLTCKGALQRPSKLPKTE